MQVASLLLLQLSNDVTVRERRERTRRKEETELSFLRTWTNQVMRRRRFQLAGLIKESYIQPSLSFFQFFSSSFFVTFLLRTG